jgi:predicted  nucleic acid-binding Zn-ribbon protein
MLDQLKVILEIQELDMKMLRLMRLKKTRQNEINHIWDLRKDLENQLSEKKKEIFVLSQEITEEEANIETMQEKVKKLEEQQASVKKVEEFNAITREMNDSERKRVASEQKASDLIDKQNMEQEILNKIKDSLKASAESSKALEEEILSGITMINTEGKELQERRMSLAKTAEPEYLKIYEKLLRNKKDRVVVLLENRTCSGCHISLTAQHENLVRKSERLVFCEHCSRIHYWEEEKAAEGVAAPTRRRRRKTVTA